jgi:hypothetical protein
MSGLEGQNGNLVLAVSFTGFDPAYVKTLKAVVNAQQKNRTCGLGESFMRDQHFARINVAPEQPARGFSRSQDPKPT